MAACGATDDADSVQVLPSRPRRNRRSETVRSAVRENSLGPENFILPLFVHEGDKNEPIASMPGVERLSYSNGLVDFVSEARSYGINSVVIFPKVRTLLALYQECDAPRQRCSLRWAPRKLYMSICKGYRKLVQSARPQ